MWANAEYGERYSWTELSLNGGKIIVVGMCVIEVAYGEQILVAASESQKSTTQCEQ